MKFLIINIFLMSVAFQPDLDVEKKCTIYVASIGWHTGIIVPYDALPDSIWSSGFNFSGYDYLEIGWGDKDYYQHPKFNLWYAFKAIFWPTPTALHIFPLKKEFIKRSYANTRLVELEITRYDLEKLAYFLVSQFEFNENGRVIPLDDGFYYNSQFFAGSKKYFFPKNSNVWAASALKKAGFRYSPVFYQTTGMVVKRADKFAVVVEDF